MLLEKDTSKIEKNAPAPSWLSNDAVSFSALAIVSFNS